MNEWGMSDWSVTESGSRMNKVARWIAQKLSLENNATPTVLASAAAAPSLNGVTYEVCYIAGLDPDDPLARFRTTITMDANGKPIVSWSPDLNDGGTKNERVYRVFGSKSLGASAEWDDITDITNPDAEGYRFFKATVEMP